MSTRDDARLTARERAALSNLEAAATADDPQLAARLRGPGRWRVATRLPKPPSWLRNPWLAIPAVLVGLLLAVLSLSTGWLSGVIGAGVAAYGLWLAVGALESRLESRREAG